MSRFPILLPILLLLPLLACSSPPPAGGTRQINIVAKKYEFQPSTVHIRLGETVLLHISTTDVQHGFEVPELGIRQSIQPHFPADITIHATRPGHFRVACSIKCGPGHDDMAGEIVVE